MSQTTYEQSQPIEELRYNCTRCGIEINVEAIRKRQHRGDQSLECFDCKHIDGTRSNKWQGTACKPWHGEVDLDTFAPLNDDGSLYLPGARKCGHADCVNRNHIQRELTPEELTAERFSTYYRTGERLNYKQLLKAVQTEARAA
jgi:DNA-directed RNA polymerase subunit RPC12/RpoP